MSANELMKMKKEVAEHGISKLSTSRICNCMRSSKEAADLVCCASKNLNDHFRFNF